MSKNKDRIGDDIIIELKTIGYTNKSFINENIEIPAQNKVQDVDMNEIKEVVNDNSNTLLGLHKFSYSETIIGYTDDNEPVYRKMIDFGTLPNNTKKSVPHGITNLGEILDIGGRVRNDSAINYLPLPLVFKGADSNYNVELVINDINIIMRSNTNRNNFSAVIILIYKKIKQE